MVVFVIAASTSSALVLIVLELVVVLLSLAGIDAFKYILGSSMFSWLAHRIYS